MGSTFRIFAPDSALFSSLPALPPWPSEVHRFWNYSFKFLIVVLKQPQMFQCAITSVQVSAALQKWWEKVNSFLSVISETEIVTRNPLNNINIVKVVSIRYFNQYSSTPMLAKMSADPSGSMCGRLDYLWKITFLMRITLWIPWCLYRSSVLPIVMGAPLKDYELVAPYKSFIHVDQFPEGPEALARYLHQLDRNDTLYNEYFQWKGTGQLINTFFLCRLCA